MFRLLAIVSWACAISASPAGRIIHGDPTTISQVPFQISLLRTSSNSHTCGGSILTANYILTAGHCAGQPASGYRVRSGSSHWNRGGQLHDVVEVIRHEEYHGNDFGSPVNDIALMRVDPPFEFGETRRPVRLIKKNAVAKAGVPAVVTGWGKTENKTLADQLQTLTIAIVSKTACDAAYKNQGGLPDDEICAADPTGLRDMCNGDSGGPLVIHGRQAGIVSWSGPGCALPQYPGVYTEVARYRDWIAKHVDA